MNWIIIRMPDGTYAKVPAGSAPSPPEEPKDPPDPPPPTGDWVSRDEFEDEVAERKAADEALQEQIDRIGEHISELEDRIEDLESGAGPGGPPPEELVELVERVQVLEDKRLILPVREVTETPITTRSYLLKYKGGIIQPGPVTVLSADGGRPAFAPNGFEITGTVNSAGIVTFNTIPNQKVTIVFGVELSFSELPKEAFQEMFITELDRDVDLIYQVDRIDRDLELEQITPSALSATAVGDSVYLSWAYKDTPNLSHFIVEVQDPTTGQWVPYDGKSGVVTK